MLVLDEIRKLQDICRVARGKGQCLNLVPTMGALHEGHVALVRRSRHADNAVTIVTIFVNPKQFNNQNDLTNYPRTVDHDLELLRELQVDYVFMPTVDIMYPDTHECMIRPPDILAKQLEGRSRPGHFDGMLTIVCKLFNLIKPDQAYFGEKDFQQLILVKKMVQDLNMEVEIEPVSTVRESDLLPLSSRNSRLNEKSRQIASAMSRIIFTLKKDLESESSPIKRDGRSVSDIILDSALTIRSQVLADKCADLHIDYVELRCSEHFADIIYSSGRFDCNPIYGGSTRRPTSETKLKCRLLIAAVVDGVRLLDNVEVELD